TLRPSLALRACQALQNERAARLGVRAARGGRSTEYSREWAGPVGHPPTGGSAGVGGPARRGGAVRGGAGAPGAAVWGGAAFAVLTPKEPACQFRCVAADRLTIPSENTT